MPCLLYAVILAQATNLGLSAMARASQFTYQQLEWAWEQLCREDTLTAASASLIDFHHGLPLAQAWGTSRLSSSDAQRFAARTRAPGTAALPRYFGHRRRGLQIYSWTSDQYSQPSTRARLSPRQTAMRRTRSTGSSTTRRCCRSRSTRPTPTAKHRDDLRRLRPARPAVRPTDPRSGRATALPPRYPARHRNRRAAQTQDPPRAYHAVLGRSPPARCVLAPRVGPRVAAAHPAPS